VDGKASKLAQGQGFGALVLKWLAIGDLDACTGCGPLSGVPHAFTCGAKIHRRWKRTRAGVKSIVSACEGIAPSAWSALSPRTICTAENGNRTEQKPIITQPPEKSSGENVSFDR